MFKLLRKIVITDKSELSLNEMWKVLLKHDTMHLLHLGKTTEIQLQSFLRLTNVLPDYSMSRICPWTPMETLCLIYKRFNSVPSWCPKPVSSHLSMTISKCGITSYGTMPAGPEWPSPNFLPCPPDSGPAFPQVSRLRHTNVDPVAVCKVIYIPCNSNNLQSWENVREF